MTVAMDDIEEWGAFVRASINSDTMMSRRRIATIALSALIGKIHRLLEEVHYLEEDAKMVRESFTSLVIERDRFSERESAISGLPVKRRSLVDNDFAGLRDLLREELFRDVLLPEEIGAISRLLEEYDNQQALLAQRG